jgi:hypothetical protein
MLPRQVQVTARLEWYEEKRTVKRRSFFGAAAAACASALYAQPADTGGRYNVRDHGRRREQRYESHSSRHRPLQNGGRVVFPPGQYRTGMVRLKSHVTIELRSQAVWRAIPDLALYPNVGVRSGAPVFLFAENQDEIHITGEGKIPVAMSHVPMVNRAPTRRIGICTAART